MLKRLGFTVASLVALAGCGAQPTATRGRIVSPTAITVETQWTAEEKAKPIAVRPVRTTPEMSVLLIRVKGAEKPHIHATHDLTVIVLSGRGVLHIGERKVDVRPGDVLEIPKGVPHWAENTAPEASEVYAIFSPPYLDNKDNVPVEK